MGLQAGEPWPYNMAYSGPQCCLPGQRVGVAGKARRTGAGTGESVRRGPPARMADDEV